MNKYCWMFGDHKSDPCPCGWTSQYDIHCFLQRQISEANRQTEQTEDAQMIHYLQGMNDGFRRVVLFLNTVADTKKNDEHSRTSRGVGWVARGENG